MSKLEHVTAPLFRNADNCDHPEPADEVSREWSDWDADHPRSVDIRERICLDTPAGNACPACTDEARDEEDLPEDEYVSCKRDVPATS